MRSINHEAGQNTKQEIKQALDRALTIAQARFSSNDTSSYDLSPRLLNALENLSSLVAKASTAFTNIVTALAIKIAKPSVDVRFHQVQIQSQEHTQRGAGFNFRSISEKTVYPWLNEHSFEGAKSGWQTRTFERPKPYTLDYDENIGAIKEPFLTIYDEIEESSQSAENALAYLIYRQLVKRESQRMTLLAPRTQDIEEIIKLFTKHFFYGYRASRGASRLPVLALYAIYSMLISELERYEGMQLKPLEEHSAADSQTGAVGDIEIVRQDTGLVFEAIEVKHNIALNEVIIQHAITKIMDKSVDRYYVLTTHHLCQPDEQLAAAIAQARTLYNCQLIANGVMQSLKYYLRLLSDPSRIFPQYVELLRTDSAIQHEHREIWNKIASGSPI